jgi:hypothetical protein
MYGHNIIDYIREMLNCMHSWQIDHASRVVNSAAYGLAKTAVKSNRSGIHRINSYLYFWLNFIRATY